MYLFQLTAQHGSWLALRQAVTAANVANADTPGYKARDVSAFTATLDQTSLQLAQTGPGHMALPALQMAGASEIQPGNDDASASGNTVNLEQELGKFGEIGRMQALDVSLTRTFQRFLLSSLKG